MFYPLYAIKWEVGAFAIFLSWLNLLLMFQRLYIFGIYVVMFVQILKTITKVLVLFFILFIGFGLVFYICLNYPVNSFIFFCSFKPLNYYPSNLSSKLYSLQGTRLNMTPPLAIMRTIVMMQGSDIDGLNSFLIPFTKDNMQYGTICTVFLLIFIFIVPILLINLLVEKITAKDRNFINCLFNLSHQF